MQRFIIVLLLLVCMYTANNTIAQTTDSLKLQPDSALQYLTGSFKKYDPNRAFQIFLQQALNGDAKAMNAVGLQYAKGLGVDSSFTQAVLWLTQAGNNNYAKAWVNLGMLHKQRAVDSTGYAIACQYFTRALTVNEPSAYFAQGYMLYKGLGCAQSYTDALALFNAGVAANRADCMYFKGLCFKYGYGLPLHADSANHYLDRAALLGYKQANAALAQGDSSVGISGAARRAERYKHNKLVKAQHPVHAAQPYSNIPLSNKKPLSIIGTYKGLFTQYDYSGKYIANQSPLTLSVDNVLGDKIIVKWILNNSTPIVVQAMQSGNQWLFSTDSFLVPTRYITHKKQPLVLKRVQLSTNIVADTVFLNGTVQLYNTYTKEISKPITIKLVQTEKPTANSQKLALAVFPNPVRDKVTVSLLLNSVSTVRLRVYNTLGVLVYQQNSGVLPAGRQQLILRMPPCPSGMYTLTVVASGSQEAIPFVKE